MLNSEKLVVISKAQRVFQNLLLLYPDTYRKKFGQEMLIAFEDLYTERLINERKSGIFFWLVISLDIVKSAFEQHRELIIKKGMKKYIRQTLHINIYNIIGGLLLLPFLSVFFIDLIARIAQGDLTHYNRPVYALLSHSLLYWFPVLFTWVILFPALAIIINLIPLIKNILKKYGSFLLFIKQNVITLAIFAVGLAFLAIIKLHDFAPCFLHGLLKVGINQLPQIFSVCRNA